MEGVRAQVNNPKLFPEDKVVINFRDEEVYEEIYPREHLVHTDSISI